MKTKKKPNPTPAASSCPPAWLGAGGGVAGDAALADGRVRRRRRLEGEAVAGRIVLKQTILYVHYVDLLM